jgi:hypothetical protein
MRAELAEPRQPRRGKRQVRASGLGNASQAVTSTFDPNAYLDVYYLLDANGAIRYYNTAPEATMSALLQHVNAFPT